jgi:hypothetical protein
MVFQWFRLRKSKRGKSPGGFGDHPYRSTVGRQKVAEFRAPRSDFERMLHLRARTFAPFTYGKHNPLIKLSQELLPKVLIYDAANLDLEVGGGIQL